MMWYTTYTASSNFAILYASILRPQVSALEILPPKEVMWPDTMSWAFFSSSDVRSGAYIMVSSYALVIHAFLAHRCWVRRLLISLLRLLRRMSYVRAHCT